MRTHWYSSADKQNKGRSGQQSQCLRPSSATRNHWFPGLSGSPCQGCGHGGRRGACEHRQRNNNVKSRWCWENIPRRQERSTPPPKRAPKQHQVTQRQVYVCVWGWGGYWKGALFTVWSPPAPHSLSHFKQSYWQGSGSSPCFQGHWSFKEVKEGSSLEATGPRLAYLASVVARWSGHIGKTLARRPMQMAPVAAFLGVDLSLSVSLSFS